MMKRNKIRVLAVVLVVLTALIGWIVYDKVILKEAPYIPYISDESLDWDSVKQIEVYAVSCAIPPSEVITDESIIKKIINTVRNTSDYEEVPKDLRYKGLMSHWLRFDNGVVIGIYNHKNYGYVGMELSQVGNAPFYYLPLELFDLIRELSVEPVAKLETILRIEQDAYKEYDTVEEYLEALKLPTFIHQIQPGNQLQVVEKKVLVGESYTAINYECEMEAEVFNLQLGTYHFPYAETCLQQIMEGNENLFSEIEIDGNLVYDYHGSENDPYHYYFVVRERYLCVLAIEQGYDNFEEMMAYYKIG